MFLGPASSAALCAVPREEAYTPKWSLGGARYSAPTQATAKHAGGGRQRKVKRVLLVNLAAQPANSSRPVQSPTPHTPLHLSSHTYAKALSSPNHLGLISQIDAGSQMVGATAARRIDEAHASPRAIRHLIDEARSPVGSGWGGFRSVLEDLDPSPPASPSEVDDVSDSDDDGEAAAWWRREHGDAAKTAPAVVPARNRPAAADRQEDCGWEGPTPDGDRVPPPRRRPPPASTRNSLYDVLGVAAGAPRADLKRAYRALALRLHPDKCASPASNARFVTVQEAYATLGDRSRRAAYEASIR